MKYTKKVPVSFAITTAIALLTAMPATAGQDPFIGEINYVGFNFAPTGWALCDGQEIPISQNAALFSLLGTFYGGNGQTTFKLPDMRGRVPVHQGRSSTGGTVYSMGQTSGTETATLTINNMPTHNHPATATSTSTIASGASVTSTLKAASSDAGAATAQGNSLANIPRGGPNIYSATAPNVDMNSASVVSTLTGLGVTTTTMVTVDNAGNGQAFPIMQPYLVVNCIIATQGIFPSRP